MTCTLPTIEAFRPPQAIVHAVFAILLLALSAAMPATAAGLVRYEGNAYAPDSERLLYREIHWLYEDDGVRERLVVYRCPDGDAFARKRVRDVPSATAPDFAFVDGRDGYREGVRHRDGRREVHVREHADTQVRVEALPDADMVIDAGFDAYIRAHWEALAAGQTLRMPFLIPSRFEAMDFSLEQVDDRPVLGVPAREFRMRLDAWYGFALPSIEVAYARGSHRLLRFRGLGTIRDADGEHQTVRIEFPPQARNDDASRAALQAAAQAPLVRSCTR